MLWAISIVLPGVWLVGVLTSHTFGGLIHLLPAIALVAISVAVIRAMRGAQLLSPQPVACPVRAHDDPAP